MKKLSLLRGSMILALAVGGLAGCAQQAQMARAEIQASDLQNLLTKYNDGGYTKKTTMYLTPEAQGETQYFHAGANQLQRATYYNADETALLMGNYDGTFNGVAGATGINSGYRNKGEGVEHFKYVDETANAGNLFLAAKTTGDWTSDTQTVGGYYQTLSSLAASINNDDWIWSDGAFIHDVKNLTVTDGEYNDPILKKFQYFAAPMMLQNDYFSWHTIRVVEGASFLSIRLYATSADYGKSTMHGTGEDGEALISEARIYKGVNLSPEVVWKLKGSVIGWSDNDGIAMNYSADLYIPEQYSLTRTFAKNEEFKLNSGTEWRGYKNLENKNPFDGSDNIKIKAAGEYTIYFKPTASSEKQIYIAIPSVTYTISWTQTWIADGEAKLFACLFDSTDSGTWVYLADYDRGTSVAVTVPINIVKITIVRSDKKNTTGGWNKADGYWNKTQDIMVNPETANYNNINWYDL